MPQYCQINTVHHLVFLLFKLCKLTTQTGRSTQGRKKLVWGCCFPNLSLRPHSPRPFNPTSAAQQHKTSTESFKLSNKSAAVWIINIIQTVQMIFLFQMDLARWSGTRRVKHKQQKWNSSGWANWWSYKNKTRNCIFKTFKDALYYSYGAPSPLCLV